MASELPRFYVLKPAPGSSRDTSFERVGDRMGEAPRCPRCGDIIGKLPWLPPYRVKLDVYGEHLGDFARGFGGTALLSERFATAYRDEGLTGLEGFEPVEVVRVRRQRRGPKPPSPPAYVYVTSMFGGAAVDEARSSLRRSAPISCDWCRATGVDAIHGFTLEAESWNGADAFVARGLPGSLVVSERFTRFVEQHQFTNMCLTPTEEFTWDPLSLGPSNHAK